MKYVLKVVPKLSIHLTNQPKYLGYVGKNPLLGVRIP